MKKLKELIKYCHIKVINGGKCPIFTKIESEYKNFYKIPHYNFLYNDKMGEEMGKRIADVFASKQHTPEDFYVKAAYEQLVKEVIMQFEFLRNSEVKIDFEPYEKEGEPYDNSFEMLMDIHENYHMYFFKTENGFGETTKNEDNLMLRKTGFFVGDYELIVNDIFRIVHDIFGHAAYGYSFGPVGEDMAWMVHCQMFSPLARAAITTETRGQNCWVNFGPHMRNENDQLRKQEDDHWLAPSERPFAEQKMALLPWQISGVKLFEEKGKVKATHVKDWSPFFNLMYI